jgi:predicted Zn-dependent protease with MMP-like domain/predicted Zn-dependent protease
MTDPPRKLADLLDEAYEALAEGQLDAARQDLDEARRHDADRDQGQSAEVRLLEIELLDAEGKSEEAVSAAEEALDDLPKSMLLKLRLATLLLDVYDDVIGARPHLEELLARLDSGEQTDAAAPLVGDEKTEARDDFLFEVLLTLSDARAADHDPKGALEVAARAQKASPDDPMARVALGAAQFDVCKIDDAEKSVAQAIDRDPRCADAFWLRGRILTAKGDDAGADVAFARAVKLDHERFQNPFRIAEDGFAKLMEESYDELPAQVKDYLRNVAVTVEDVPPLERLTSSDPPLSPGSLGLYEGTPPSLAPGDDPWSHFPSRITLFRKNIEISSTSEDELKDLVSSTLLHEVGHYLGLDEEDLDERGLG